MVERVVEGLNWKTQNKQLIVVNKDPYGFMHFQFKEGGAIPKELSGAYTNMKDVVKDGDKYIKAHPRTHNADNERPVPKTKKPTAKALVKAEQIKEGLKGEG
jgi:hypothetical protein